MPFSLVVAGFLAFSSGQLAETSAADVLLRSGDRSARRVSEGERHGYRLWLDRNWFARVLVEQKGIDLTVAIVDADGKSVREMDRPIGDRGVEEISWIAETSGFLRIQIRPTNAETLGGEYEIRLEELREAGSLDRKRVEAEEAFAEGVKNLFQEVAGTRERSLEPFGRALKLWQELGDRRQEAITLFDLGRAHNSLNRADVARDLYTRSLEIWREIGEQRAIAETLYGLAFAARFSGNTDRAREHFAEALSIARSEGDRSFEGEVLTSQGGLEDSLGERKKALANYETALPLMQATRNRSGECRTIINIAFVRDYLGEKQRALDGYRKALGACESLDSKRVQSQILANLGRVYVDLGEAATGLEYLVHARSVIKGIGDVRSEAAILLTIGRARSLLEDKVGSVQAYTDSLGLWKQVGEKRREGAARNLLGGYWARNSEPEKALAEFERALELVRQDKDPYLEASVLANRGALLSEQGKKDLGRLDLEAAIPLYRAVGDRLGEASTLFELARLEEAIRHGERAWELCQIALDRVESLRTEVASADLRASFFATVQKIYDFSIDLLLRRSLRERRSAALAFEVNERSRARSLIDLLSARDSLQQGIDPELVRLERSLRKKIAARADPPIRVPGESRLSVASAAEIEKLRLEYQHVQDAIRSASPRYATLAFGDTLQADTLQRDLLDDNTLLLEYRLGHERSYLWVIGRATLEVHELASRGDIEGLARRANEAWRNSGSSDWRRASADLSDRILSPAAARLAGRRLVFVPDGALQLTAFAALPEPRGGARSEPAREPLVATHEVLVLPSASVLAALRRDSTARPGPGTTLAVIADPVFDPDDPRVHRRPAAVARKEGEALAEKRSVPTLTTLPPRLAFTRREADALRDLVPAQQRFIALDFDASLETAISPELSRYRYVHFATHGLVDGEHPDRSGLLLSTVDGRGRAREGFLSVAEIFNLRFSAELIVLSACQTALGKDIRGEGLVGLTRAFIYAGAPRVVASLWRVDDAATAELMKKFYQGMLGARQLRPAAALREAQLAISRQQRWWHPYYWAGFVLQGEWR